VLICSPVYSILERITAVPCSFLTGSLLLEDHGHLNSITYVSGQIYPHFLLRPVAGKGPAVTIIACPRKMSYEQITLNMYSLKYNCKPNTGLGTGQALKSVSENIIRKKYFFHLVFCLEIDDESIE
jgi:hypothetical protein